MRDTTHDELAELRAGRLPQTCGGRANALLARLSSFGGASLPAEPTPNAPSLQADLRSGAVQVVDCVVDWERAGHVHAFRARGAPHVVVHPAVYQPALPGPWRLYVLPASGLVVGGEAPGAPVTAPGAPTQSHVSAYRQTLLSAQGHTPDDIAALRRGHIPRSAVAWGRAGRTTQVLVAIATWLVAAGLVGVGPASPPSLWLSALGERLPIAWLAAPLFGVFALVLTARVVTAKRTSVHRGTAVAIASSGGPAASWGIDVGGTIFRSHAGHPLAAALGPLLVPNVRVVAFQVRGTLVAIDLDDAPP